MKIVDKLIERVRRETRNADSGDTSAGESLSDVEFVDALQDAQEMCQETLSGVFSKLFEVTEIIDCVAGQAEYDLNASIHLGTRVVSVEFSANGNIKTYYTLRPVDIRERYSGTDYYYHVSNYIRSARQLILTPAPPSTGKLRVVYEATLKPLYKRLGKVSSVSGTLITAVTLDFGSNELDSRFSELEAGDEVSIIDKDGTPLYSDATVVSKTDTTIVLDFTGLMSNISEKGSLDEQYLFLNSDYTNKSALPDVCEKYLVAWARWHTFDRDGSALANGAMKKLQVIEQSLIKSYIMEDKDMPAIPETDY